MSAITARMVSQAHALCPTDLPHHECMDWMADYLSKSLDARASYLEREVQFLRSHRPIARRVTELEAQLSLVACGGMSNELTACRESFDVDVRRCDVCDHIGICDASETQGACHNCDWQGPEQVEDKCPECGYQGCMAAACPECGGRYALLAERQFRLVACGGCGNSDETKRCLGCRHNFKKETANEG